MLDKRTNQAFTTASALLAAVALLAAGSAGAEPVGFVAVAEGDVQVQPYGTDSFEAAARDMDVSVGDTIRTGPASQAKVLLVDDTTLSIDEETEIQIQSLHVGAAATQDRSIIRQTRGRLRTVVGSAFGGQTNLEVHTPTAVVGVKGTDFTSEEDPDAGSGQDRWLYCLVDGKIVVTTESGVSQPRPGYCVYAYQDGDISDEFEAVRPVLDVNFQAALSGFGGGGDFVEPAAVGEGPPETEIEIETDFGGNVQGGDELGQGSNFEEEEVIEEEMMEEMEMEDEESPQIEF